MSKHKNFKEMFSAYLDNELTGQEQQTVIEHLEQCGPCRKEFNALQRLENSFKTWKDQDVSLDLEQVIAANSKQEPDEKKPSPANKTKKLLAGIMAVVLAGLVMLGLRLHEKNGISRHRQAAGGQISEQKKAEAPLLAGMSEQSYRSRRPGFVDTATAPLSTFAIDVDTASYTNMRRFLAVRQLPPPDAVDIAGLINYFAYDYQQPQPDQPFSITTEIAACPWDDAHDVLLIGLQGRRIPAEKLPPSNLVFLLDVSGSMDEPDKLPLLKNVFKTFIGQLQSQDRVAIVVYGGAAGVVLDSTSGSNKEAIIDALDWLSAGGSTAAGIDIEAAFQIAEANFIKGGNNRVILATDGDFNLGLSSQAELGRLADEERAKGIFFTVLGFGMADYKGNGNCFYIDTAAEAQKAFEQDLKVPLAAIAKDVKILVEFNPAKIKTYRLIGSEEHIAAKQDFKDDAKASAELAAGRSVTALYEIAYAEPQTNDDDLVAVKLSYKDNDNSETKLLTGKVNASSRTDKPSRNFQFATAVAEYGLLLGDQKYKANASFEAAIKQAKQAKGDDPFGYRAEFIQLLEAAQVLHGLSAGSR